MARSTGRAYVSTVFWLLLGLYIAAAGWEATQMFVGAHTRSPDGSPTYMRDDIIFRDASALWTYIRHQRVLTYYPWITFLDETFLPVVLGVGLGLAGGSLRNVIDLLQPQRKPRSRMSIYPLFGCIVGLLAGTTATFVPGNLGDKAIPPAVISFFGGVFADVAWPWVQAVWRKVFKPA
jgi:hypothetical protein